MDADQSGGADRRDRPATGPDPVIDALLGSSRNRNGEVESGAEHAEAERMDKPDRTAFVLPLTASSVYDHTVEGADLAPRTAESLTNGPTDRSGSTLLIGTDSDAAGEVDVTDDPAADDDNEISATRNLIEWIVVLAAAVAVAILLRTFVFQAFFIPSESMEQTLYEGDRILVNKVSYHLHDINRGDLVVFRRPDDQPGEIRDLIKRVVGLPGETVEVRNSQVYIDGQLLVEPYLDGNPFGEFGPVTVPEGELFLMGDNRDDSYDSRRFGTIGEDRVIGRAFVLFWPPNRLGSL